MNRNNNIFLLEEVIKKNFSSKYKESVLGILWSVLNPLLTMILLTIIFSTIFQRSIENYPVYLLSGRCIFSFFTAGTSAAMNSIRGSKTILTKTPAPKFIFVLGGILSEFYNFLISLATLIVVMIVTGAPFNWTMLISFFPVLCLLGMVLGVGLILSIVIMYFNDINHLWSIVVMMLMYASAIFYPMDIIPIHYRQFLILNPTFWAVDQFRCLFAYGTIPDPLNMFNFFVLSLIVLITGIIVFKKFEKRIIMKF